MTTRWVAVAAALAGAIVALAHLSCHGDQEAGAPPRARPATAAPAPSAAPSTRRGYRRRPRARSTGAACVARRVRGTATSDTQPLATGAPLAGRTPVDLAAGAELVVQHGRSTREWRLRGPARAIPCHEGAERWVLAHGVLEGPSHAGERPGAEVRVATPAGTVAYASATLTITVTPRKAGARQRVTVAVSSGTARFQGKVVARGADESATASPVPQLLGACEARARRTAELARAVLAPTSAGDLGGRSARYVAARRDAQSRCDAARAALVGSPADADAGQRLGRALTELRRVPTTPDPAPSASSAAP